MDTIADYLDFGINTNNKVLMFLCRVLGNQTHASL